MIDCSRQRYMHGRAAVVITDSDGRRTISLRTSTASDHLARVWRRRVATAGKCPPRGGAGRQTVDENPGVRRLFSAAAVVIGSVTSRCLTAPVVRTLTIREQASGHQLIILQDRLIRSGRHPRPAAIRSSLIHAWWLSERSPAHEPVYGWPFNVIEVTDLHSRIVSRLTMTGS